MTQVDNATVQLNVFDGIQGAGKLFRLIIEACALYARIKPAIYEHMPTNVQAAMDNLTVACDFFNTVRKVFRN